MCFNGCLVTEELKLKQIDENYGKTCVFISTPTEWTRFWILFRRNVVQLHREWVSLVRKNIVNKKFSFFYIKDHPE